MITEDEVMSLLQRADPARRLVAPPDADAAAYLDSLRARSRDVTLIDTEPEETQPDEVAADPRRLPPWIYAVAGGVIAAGLVAASSPSSAKRAGKATALSHHWLGMA